MSEVKNILLVGVGGQGTILASKILSNGLVSAGYDVKMSEVHGMAQRGGSVSTQVRYGKKVYSPIIGKGQADILVSFETMEALRWLEYLAPTGKVVVNDYQIPSAPILMGKREYPAGVLELLKEKADTTVICAAQIAERLGNAKAMNVVLFGALVKAMKIDYIDWEEVIKTSVKASAVPVNLLAFQEGLKVK
ncbi:indolepyruvate oxidoreductase subunit beta [Anaeromusa sp.]|uniref:indolepyruvate oxidoreductase subunit beta n=1 Tax=Anaeromusa sp. TaxID=1872520 RepID=UPI00262985CA|nr:indolepyruvate oxidoreductase subunit beta [Anaeromusa sp.]MDD3159299.1 indolepyruvate oxidoreductase subunit beta [Anaeromusa sp.]MEA4836049.1 indolepyruvate oxidoreductase subunit beta [Anaeromusa sp.]